MELQISLTSTFQEFDISCFIEVCEIQNSSKKLAFVMVSVLIRPITLERTFRKVLINK